MPAKVEASEGAVLPTGTAIFGLGCASSTPITLVPDDALFALIQPLTQNIRWTDDGSVPTATRGNQLAFGATLKYTGGPASLRAMRFIQETATATVNISFYKSAA